jgi:hypothetical protein
MTACSRVFSSFRVTVKSYNSNVTLTFDETTGWSLPKRNSPCIVTLGRQHAYGVALNTFDFVRYRYQ